MGSSTPQNDDAAVLRSAPIIMRYLLTIGVPVGAGWIFAQSVTKNVWGALIITALCGLGGFALNFVGKVWQKLEGPLVDLASGWLTARGQVHFSGYRRHFCQHLIYEHQVFDVKGLTTRAAYDLELEHVFVELSVDPTPAHQTSANPLRVPPHLRDGDHTIWDFLSSRVLQNQHYVIIGAPGSGKTTLLKHMALLVAQGKYRSSHHAKSVAKKRHSKHPRLSRPAHRGPMANASHRLRHRPPTNLPLLLLLREHAEKIKEQPEYTLINAVQDHVQKKWQESVPEQWLTWHVKRGRCLVLLDGLDEIADVQTRQQVVAWVQRQMLAYGENRFVLTSRPYGYRDNPLDGVAVLEVRSFTARQIERFVQRWYLENELKSWGKDDEGMRLRAREGAAELLQRLHRVPALWAMAVNPLLLTMIATVHRYRGCLPGKRVALYAEICEVFLGKRQEARGITQELSPAQKQQVLQPLAYAMMMQGKREAAQDWAEAIIEPALRLINEEMQPSAFLRMIHETSGILLERDPGIYGFAHLTFQEYLTAIHIQKTASEAILLDHIEETWWHETIRLYCAQADATRIIEACLQKGVHSIDALTLALECYEEKLQAQPSITRQIDALLEQGVEDADPQRRRVIAEALLLRRMRQMAHIHDETYIDTKLVTCAEYQLFLDEMRGRDKYYQPDHWEAYTFPHGQGHQAVLGVRSADARMFCKWLTSRDKEEWDYRLPTQTERERLEEEIKANLPQEIDYFLEYKSARSAKKRELRIIKNILYTIQVPDVFAREIDLTHALITLDDFYPHMPFSRGRAVASTQDYVFVRNRNFTHNRDLALALVENLNQVIANNSDLALVHDQSLTRDADLAHDLDLVQDLSLINNPDHFLRTLADSCDLIYRLEAELRIDNLQSLIVPLVHSLLQALHYAHTLIFVCTLEYARRFIHIVDAQQTFDRALLLDQALARIFVHANDIEHTLTTNLDEARKLVHTIATDLPRARDLADGLALNEIYQDIATNLMFRIARYNVYLHLRENDALAKETGEKTWRELVLDRVKKLRKRRYRRNNPQRAAAMARDRYLRLYNTLAVLELRRQGKLPVWEGILLVRERKQARTDYAEADSYPGDVQ